MEFNSKWLTIVFIIFYTSFEMMERNILMVLMYITRYLLIWIGDCGPVNVNSDTIDTRIGMLHIVKFNSDLIEMNS